MQPARGLIGLARKLAAGVQGAQDDLERGFVGEFRVRIYRDAAAVVADGDRMIGVEFDLDPVGVARDGLVHRVVEHLGHKVMQRALIGAPDIHAGTFSDRLQPLQHLDGRGVIGLDRGGEEVICHALPDSCEMIFEAGLDHPGRRGARLGGGPRWGPDRQA